MKNKFRFGDKKKLIEIKRKFRIEKFDKLLKSENRIGLFDVLKKISNIDISIYDEFTVKNKMQGFFKRISKDLAYEPVIAFYYNDYPNWFNAVEMGLLNCYLKKKEFNTYLIHSDIFAGDMPQGDIRSINCFKNKGEFDEKLLTNIIYKEIKWNYPSKIDAQEVYLFKKLDWSKEKIKKLVKNSKIKFN